ncbi:HNH endonuclease [Fluoribacter dumoffii]|uniref:HNH endonuclease n=1 Tax=Fluoribacter dumoffii TaxID=463 RepID=A0A377GDW8_9GAMM|nr:MULTISPECIES: HNH endonuclease [Legionellaceae]KTC91292.1 HNH endonuclease [Fluoribacter dumoffii NY 23]MCW8387541.1 HNH endonuclease [Fluoribacter dumoffii]MCW8416914.1 HNH endonuclease [Fluoribacter dumoffii]MCW8455246.1 HNH endonuclease [Fluoribacter dumoffii]MCW8460677.1 HNH endonuclease [Fluoribacter dumoffii]
MATYRTYKPRLRIDFNYSCGYCKANEPEIGGAKNSFQIDHYQPKKEFPELINNYENLIYACRACNQYKGDYWPTPFESLLQKIILNPRVDNLEKHIDLRNFEWMAKTLRGKWNILKLRLASEPHITRRKDRAKIQQMIKKLLDKIPTFQKEILDLETKGDILNCQKLRQEYEEHLEDINTLKRKIEGPME